MDLLKCNYFGKKSPVGFGLFEGKEERITLEQMKLRLYQHFGWILIVTTFFLACKTPQDNSTSFAMKNHSPNRIVLRYQDSSVPPRYHRSYTIAATAEEVSIEVDVYGTDIGDSTHALTNEAWTKLLEMASELQKPGSYESGASGTHSHRIQLFDGEEAYYQLYWDSAKKEKVNANTEAMVEALEATIPDFPECLKKGQPVKR